MGGDEDAVVLGYDTPYVVRGLYRSFHGVAHLHHPLWNLFQTGHHILKSLAVDDRFLSFALADDTVYVRVIVAILLAQPFVHHVLLLLDEFSTLARRDAQHNLCGGGNGGISFTDVDRSHIEIVFIVDSSQDRPCGNNRTAASLVDVDTGMAA